MKKMLVVLSTATLAVSLLSWAGDAPGGAAKGGNGGGRAARAGGGAGRGAQAQDRMKEAWAEVDKAACFTALDTNADGNISKEEFEKADLQVVFGGPLREAMQKRGGAAGGGGGPAAEVTRWDKNGDGKITADEFPRGEAAFKKFLEGADKDGDGTLTVDEAKAAQEQRQQQRQERQGNKQ
jgi:hypothetical protein